MEDSERIRHRAYQLWEAEGRPEGRADRHWAQARDELGGSGAMDDDAPLDGDDTLSDLPPEAYPEEPGRADGRIVEAGEAGISGGPDEAEEALQSPVVPDAREGR